MTTSINLTERNERVKKRFFKDKGRNGRFSAWVNKMMDREFILDPEEAIRYQIRNNNKEISDIESNNEVLLKKLRIVIDKKSENK